MVRAFATTLGIALAVGLVVIGVVLALFGNDDDGSTLTAAGVPTTTTTSEAPRYTGAQVAYLDGIRSGSSNFPQLAGASAPPHPARGRT